eukprot:TRINITY_DN4191_c0_g2_i2.p1 TRINITY_DN4191_c0_g2~~TRINITY_DN4191_c0_g2_i2.p1  ORF type:complete len:811 (+),score=196.03 TRINITY_DN4191_c0_g2_i2:36-2468(+)
MATAGIDPKAAEMSEEAEVAAGISEFLRPDVPGFYCRFKEKWQDFHVYEIAESPREELHLEELITPGAVIAEKKAATAARREARAALGATFQPEPAVATSITEALGSEFAEDLFAFLRKQRPAGEAVPEGSEEPPGYLDLDGAKLGDGSKDARKRAHKAVLEAFEAFLNTETVEGDNGSRAIRIWMREAELKAKARAATSDRADERGGEEGGKKGKSKDKGKKGKGKGKKGKNKTKSSEDTAEAAEDSTGANSFGTIRREGWPKDRPDYLYFRLHKENCDTGEAVSSIARCVGRSPKQFTFAGTKDKRAITVQMVCAHRLPDDQLRRTVSHKNWDPRLRISSLEYRPARLRLGQLAGNRFRVALRGIGDAAAAAAAKEAFSTIEAGGFLNYFGLQRFGTRAVGTHHIGAAIISRDYSRAVRLLLGDEAALPATAKRKRPADAQDDVVEPACKVAKTASQETGDSASTSHGKDAQESHSAEKSQAAEPRKRRDLVQEAQKIFLETGDAQRALDTMPKNQHLERCVLGALAKQLPPAEAFAQLPHQALSLYAHAAQSFAWNLVVSRRMKDSGSKPIIGDLVFASGAGAGEGISAADVLNEEDAAMSDIEGGDDDGAPAQVDGGQLPAVKEITTAEEASAASLFDIVIPLPGSEVTYPPALRKTYEEVSASLGLSLDDFASSKLVPLRGAYRRIAVQPKGLEWKLIPASEVKCAPKGVLIESDVARLMAERPDWREAEVQNADSSTSGVVASSTEEVNKDDDGTGIPKNASECTGTDTDAVVFSVELPPSAYVTMFLREVTKQPNSVLSGLRR